MVEPLLSGIVLGLVPITITGLLVTAYLVRFVPSEFIN